MALQNGWARRFVFSFFRFGKKRLVQPTLTPRLLCSKPSTLHCNRDNWRNIVITSEFRVTFGMYCKFRFRKRFCRVDRCQQNPADILVSVKRKLFWLQAAMKIMRSWRIYCNLMDFWKKKRHPPCQSDSATNSCSKAGFFPCGSGFFHIARVFFFGNHGSCLSLESMNCGNMIDIPRDVLSCCPASSSARTLDYLDFALKLPWLSSDGEGIHLDGR